MPANLPFVGREDVIEKLLYSIKPGRMHYWISGPAGVGKTYLVEHLEQRVKDNSSGINCLFAQTDYRQKDAPQAMDKLLSDLDRELRRQKYPSAKWQNAYKEWQEDYKDYKELLWRAESDLQAPPDLRRTLALLSVDAVSILAPVAIAASGYPTIGAALAYIAQLGNGIKDFLGRRFEARDEARDKELLYQPVQSLIPKFKNALSRLDSDSVRVVLILDEYEQTCTFLETWLTLLFDDDFLQQSRLVILILSQYSLPRGSGSQCYAEFSEIRLEPFDLKETKRYLGDEYQGFSEYIYQQSGGLPLLVEALVQADGQPGAKATPRAIRTALHRLDQSILKLIKDDSLKRLARLCAVPRELNEDVFRDVQRFALKGCDEGVQEVVKKATIEWLESQPFVEDWCYDPTVRTILLRNLRNRSPRDYEDLNRYLEVICAEEIQKRDLSDGGWCEAHARRWYYGLAASPRKSLAKALADFVESLDKYYRPDDPPGTIVVLDIVGILEDLLKVMQDEEAFRLWSDYVSSFHRDVEDDVSSEKWDESEPYLELFKQLIEFHYHCGLKKGDDGFIKAYQDYDGFTNAQVIDYLKRYRGLLLKVKQDYGEAKDLWNQMLSKLPQDLANEFNEVREKMLHA